MSLHYAIVVHQISIYQNEPTTKHTISFIYLGKVVLYLLRHSYDPTDQKLRHNDRTNYFDISQKDTTPPIDIRSPTPVSLNMKVV